MTFKLLPFFLAGYIISDNDAGYVSQLIKLQLIWLSPCVIPFGWHTEVNHNLLNYIHTHHIMFFTPSSRNAVNSSAIKDLEVSQSTNQAVVTYNNGKQYLYSGICEDAMFDVIFGNVKSFGKWVNSACLKDYEVSTFALAWFITLSIHPLTIH